MKPWIAALAFLLLGACAPRPLGPAPAAPPPSPSGSPRPSPTGAVVVARVPESFDAALAAAHLTKLELSPIERSTSYSPGGEASVEGRRVTLFVGAGWNAEGLELAKDPDGRVVRVLRRPIEHVQETVVEGCQPSVFYGGRMWFERVVIELPEGTTWGGLATVSYRVERRVTRFSNVTKDGSPCPPPVVMVD